MSTVLRIGGLQLGPYKGSYERQLRNLMQISETLLSSHNLDFLCFPELMTSPYFCSVKDCDDKKFAETIPGSTTELISKIARKFRTTIIGTAYEMDKQKYYNSAFIISSKGELIGKYRKTHIPYVDTVDTKGFEKKYFTPGDEIKPFNINNHTIGILICYDRSFPEAWRSLTLQGAKVVFVLASSSGFRSEAFIEELRIRALENGVFVVAVNKYGEEKMGKEVPLQFYGKSCVIDPFGNVVEELDSKEDLYFTVELELDLIDEAREKLNYFRDRRPELYHQIIY